MMPDAVLPSLRTCHFNIHRRRIDCIDSVQVFWTVKTYDWMIRREHFVLLIHHWDSNTNRDISRRQIDTTVFGGLKRLWNSSSSSIGVS